MKGKYFKELKEVLPNLGISEKNKKKLPIFIAFLVESVSVDISTFEDDNGGRALDIFNNAMGVVRPFARAFKARAGHAVVLQVKTLIFHNDCDDHKIPKGSWDANS